jgi:hypothetical protein
MEKARDHKKSKVRRRALGGAGSRTHRESETWLRAPLTQHKRRHASSSSESDDGDASAAPALQWVEKVRGLGVRVCAGTVLTGFLFLSHFLSHPPAAAAYVDRRPAAARASACARWLDGGTARTACDRPARRSARRSRQGGKIQGTPHLDTPPPETHRHGAHGTHHAVFVSVCVRVRVCLSPCMCM